MAFNSGMRSTRRKLKSEINVVPYIDVMLVLLIIFMVVPPAQNPSEIKLPTAERSTQPPTDYIQIAVKQDAKLAIGINGTTPQGLEDVAGRGALVARLRPVDAARDGLNMILAVLVLALVYFFLSDFGSLDTIYGYNVTFALDATHTFDRTGPDGQRYPAQHLAAVTATNLHKEFATVTTTRRLLAAIEN